MDIKNYVMSIAGASLLLTLSGCPDGPTYNEPQYIFGVSINVDPPKEKIRLGDTLWLKSEFSSALIDKNSKNIIPFAGATITVALSVNELIKGQQIDFVPSLHKFKTTFRSGNWRIVEGYPYIDFDYSNNKYKMEVGIIPKETGSFMIEGVSNMIVRLDGKERIYALVLPDFNVTNKNLNIIDSLGLTLNEYIDNKAKEGLGVYAFAIVD